MASMFSDDGSLSESLPAEMRPYDDEQPATGERMMTMDELKQEMFKSLKDTGTIEAIRAQLRRRFIEKLKQHGRKVSREADPSNNGDADDDEQERPTWSIDEQLVHGLVHEYLQHHKMEHTMAVFVPEVGGPQQLLSRDAIVQMLRLPESPLRLGRDEGNQMSQAATSPPLVTVLLKELVRRLSVSTMSSATQTAKDLQDHRLALENQLRRVETTYLAECANRKSDSSAKSYEERILRYQREYDELCEKRMKEDLERFKTTELGLVRVEERKKFEREMDAIKTSMYQEHRDRLQRLQDRERELEMAFAAKKAELETSLFEARQHVFQDIEKLRVKQQEVEATYNSETRHLTMESKRLQLLGDQLKVREENMQSQVDALLREKENAWQLERLQWQSDATAREQQLQVREHEVEEGMKRLGQEKTAMIETRKEMTSLESDLLGAQHALAAAEKQLGKLDAEKKALQRELEAREELLNEDKHSMRSLSYENARLSADVKTSQNERSRLDDVLVEKASQLKQVEAEVKDLQHQLITVKMNEANAVVEERKKLMHVLEAEREDARWKENELVGRLRELQTRLAESEATAEKFQTQYEDEKVHVETLRHEVSSLHTLLAQSQSAVSARNQPSGRSTMAARHSASADASGDSSERMLMRMMEMMSQMATMQAAGGMGMSSQRPMQIFQQPAVQDPVGLQNTAMGRKEEEEAAKLKQEQDRLERELLEQREFERKKKEREAAEQQEMERRRREFQDELERERLQRAKEDQEMEEERRRRAADHEAQLQQELDEQKKAIEEAREVQKKLVDEQIAAEQTRLQQERSRDEERARIAKEEAEVAAQRLQRMRDQQEEEEREYERRRKQMALDAEDAKLHLARQQAEANAVVMSVTAPQSSAGEDETRVEDDKGSPNAVGPEASGQAAEHEAITVLVSQTPDSPDDGDTQSDVGQSDAESYHSEDDARSEDQTSVVNLDHSNDEHKSDDKIEAAVPQNDVIGEAQDETHDPVVSIETIEDVQDATHDLVLPPLAKTEEELEEERRQVAEEAKKKEDEDALDVYRQRVLARRAAEKQRQQELEDQRKREEEERAAAELARLHAVDSEDEMEKSGGSFVSSAASSSGSF